MAKGTAQGPAAPSHEGAPRRSRWVRPELGRWGALAMLVLATVIIAAACGGGSDGTVRELPPISSGSPVEMAEDEAPSFVFTLFQGQDELGAEPLTPGDLREKPLVINFWAGLCPPCRAELPDLQEFYDEFSERVTLVGVDLGQFTGLGSLQDAKNLLEELDITYPIGSTEDSGIIQDYRILGLPATVFIDAQGGIFKNWGGALNLKILREQTLQMLAQ